MTPYQKKALATFYQTGSLDGVSDRMKETLWSKGYIFARPGEAVYITPKGLRIVQGRAGGQLQEVKKKDLRRHFKTRKPAKKKRDRATTAREKKEHLEGLRTHHEKAEAQRRKALERILGPSGHSNAVKIAKASGEPFTAADVDGLTAAGWQVVAAGSVNARPGTAGIPGVLFREGDWTFTNPTTLGPGGTARALVLVGPINEATLDDLSSYGYDLTAAPKKLREATTRNPSTASVQDKAYKALKASTSKGVALRVDELAERIKATLASAADALGRLEGMGLAHVAGRDLFGPCWVAGAPQRGLFENPSSAVGKAVKKAKAWNQNDDLVTEPILIDWNPPESAIDVGQIVAIEYLSDKFDGVKRIYRHEVTKKRKLFLSLDGSTLIVDPPFKITKRGIEG